VIQTFRSDGTPVFPVTCSDGFFQIMNQYPERQVSRECWKTYNDGVNCPWATKTENAVRQHSASVISSNDTPVKPNGLIQAFR
jgi:hypothetical protein